MYGANTKVGETYAYPIEDEMLMVAKILDKRGYKLHLYMDRSSRYPFKVEVVGYKYNSGEE